MDFRQAVEAVNGLAKDPGNDTLLRLYAYYKQATVGDVAGSRPGFTNPVGRAKYDAWSAVKGMSTQEAQAAYVAEADALTG
ncbi:MAG TPA: acyl-CoA-binding protein [Dermatophilaceae bacterium]|nr:acyl-CoA-binding protein [Dermatophilaceae bacterium]